MASKFFVFQEGILRAGKDDCIFCKIVAGKAEAYRIYEDEHSLGILDVNPFTRGHCLVISKRHAPWWHDLTEKETKSLFSVSRIIAQKLKKALKPDFVCMYARGRRIPHTHIFLVPTFSGDLLDRFFNALEKAQEAPKNLVHLLGKKSMEETAALLKGVGKKK
jgi:histidine triad (HIT) family protein